MRVEQDRAGLIVLETCRVDITHPSDTGHVIPLCRLMARKAGFSERDEFLLATVASELTTNIVRYAGKGELNIRILRNPATRLIGLELYAEDHGPGIKNVELAMTDNYSTTRNSIGSGLPGVKRIMDEFSLETADGEGVRIRAVKWGRHAEG